jgi:hypothetical protein
MSSKTEGCNWTCNENSIKQHFSNHKYKSYWRMQNNACHFQFASEIIGNDNHLRAP